jgi:hypothetical protein
MAADTAAASSIRTLRSAIQPPPTSGIAPASVDGVAAAHANPAGPMQVDPAPPARGPDQPKCTVIIDNVIGVDRKGLEPELYRNAPWLHPIAVEAMFSGGLRIKCKTPADARRLISREGFADDAFKGPFTIHHPGERDPTRPPSRRLAQELRSVLTSRLPGHYDAADLRRLMPLDYVESIRDFPKGDPNRPPKRCVVMATQELADDALANGLKFLNRTVLVIPLRAPVGPGFCFKDSKPGHATVDCTSPHFVCYKCSEHHFSNGCDVPPERAKRPNCGGNHYATYRGCTKYREAVKAEIERRAARVATKLAKRNRRRGQGHQPAPQRSAPRSQNPAPVVPGTSFAAAATPQSASPSAVKQPPLAPGPQPPSVDTPSTSALQPTQFEQLFALILSLKDEVTATRKELTEVSYRLEEFESVFANPGEQNSANADYSDFNDDTAMDDSNNVIPEQQQQHV